MIKLMVVLAAVAGAMQADASTRRHSDLDGVRENSVRAAVIRGTVTLSPAPARRVANRYAGASAQAAQQTMPAVVYLRGAGLPASAAAAVEMAQRDTAFSPALLIVATGSSVEFRNRDPFYHNVFSYSKAKRFDLGRFPRPESKAVRFDQAGMVEVFCEIHRSMRAVVLVTDNRFHTEVSADGSYSIPDVPAGQYEMVVWHADRGQKIIRVTVPPTGVVTVNASL